LALLAAFEVKPESATKRRMMNRQKPVLASIETSIKLPALKV